MVLNMGKIFKDKLLFKNAQYYNNDIEYKIRQSKAFTCWDFI